MIMIQAKIANKNQPIVIYCRADDSISQFYPLPGRELTQGCL